VFDYRDEYSIPGSDIVQQEITKRMKGFVSYGSGNREGTAINLCAGCCRGHVSHMANFAADSVEQV